MSLEFVLSEVVSRALNVNVNLVLNKKPKSKSLIPFFHCNNSFLLGGDLVVCYQILRFLGLQNHVDLSYLPEDQLEDCSIFSVCCDIARADIYISSFLLNKLATLKNHLTAFTITAPVVVRVWLVNKTLALEVNKRFFQAILINGDLKMEKEIEPIKLDLSLGTLELSAQEYERLRLGETIKIHNLDELQCALLSCGVKVGEAKLVSGQDGFSLEVTSLKFNRFLREEV